MPTENHHETIAGEKGSRSCSMIKAISIFTCRDEIYKKVKPLDR